MTGRLVLLVTSPRVAPGLLSREAWRTLDTAASVHALEGDPQGTAVADADVPVLWHGDVDPAALARELVAQAGEDTVVWIGSADGDPGLDEAVATEVTRLPEPPDVELLVGSHDVPGARLLDAVAVMDRLRSPGGCPWDARQTHESLVPYLLEEAHEAIEAIEAGDRDGMVEELGDVLLQVLFHARVGEEDEAQPFDVDDVAGALVDKLVRRHPHVFADVDAPTAEHVEANWAQIKAAEKASRSHPLEGVPGTLPALARADAYVGRLEKAGREDVLDAAAARSGLGPDLLALVRRARGEGADAEAALRETLRSIVHAVAGDEEASAGEVGDAQ